MRWQLPFLHRVLILLPALAFGFGGTARAQEAGLDETRPLWLTIPQVSVGLETEALKENIDLQGAKTTHEYLSIIPLVGLRAQGAIYHPNLMSFDISGEGGYAWATDKVQGSGTDQTRNQNQTVLRYLAELRFLSSKPYNGSLFAAQDHTYQTYDFFNSATVDSWRYGGRASWTTPDWTLGADTGYRREDSTGSTGNSSLADTYFNFNGVNHRASGSSTMTFNYDSFANQVDSAPVQNSVSYAAGASDSETFGSRKQINATTGLSYSLFDYLSQATETIHANENITINHLPTLDSFYNFYYNYSKLDPTTASVLQGMGGIRHRLYESLTSTLDIHGTSNDSSGSGSSTSNDSYGVGLAEDYNKQLSSWGRLSIGGAIIADHNDQDSSGSILTTIDEPHVLYLTTDSRYQPAYLNHPRVLASTIQVRGPIGPATVNVDYLVIPSGALTEIRLIQGSAVLRNGDTVFVTYESESLFTASYEALNGSGQIRVDFFRTFGIYGRVNWLDNNAPPETLVETLTALVGGADVTWRGFRLGGEYEDYDSNFTQYQDLHFYENYSRQMSQNSSLGVDFAQNFYRYSDGRREDFYQFVGRFNSQLQPWLWWVVEGGYQMQDVFGTQQDMATVRTGLTGNFGKLSWQAGYQYNNQYTSQSASTERRDRNFLYIHIKRAF